MLDEGAVVLSGAPILRLIEDTNLEARVGVPVDVAAGVHVGEEVEVTIRGGLVRAQVTGLVPEVDANTRTTDVILTFEGSVRALPGEAVRLEIAEAVEERGFWVPTTALTPGTRGLWSGYTLARERQGLARVERHELEVLHTTGDRSLVRGTLQAGDRLVAEGVHRIVPGQIVRDAR